MLKEPKKPMKHKNRIAVERKHQEHQLEKFEFSKSSKKLIVAWIQPKISFRQNSHENAFFAIFKRVYGDFGVSYGIHRSSDDFYWPNPHFLKFWGAYDQKQQKLFF